MKAPSAIWLSPHPFSWTLSSEPPAPLSITALGSCSSTSNLTKEDGSPLSGDTAGVFHLTYFCLRSSGFLITLCHVTPLVLFMTESSSTVFHYLYLNVFVPCFKVPSTPEVMSTCLLSNYVALARVPMPSSSHNTLVSMQDTLSGPPLPCSSISILYNWTKSGQSSSPLPSPMLLSFTTQSHLQWREE